MTDIPPMPNNNFNEFDGGMEQDDSVNNDINDELQNTENDMNLDNPNSSSPKNEIQKVTGKLSQLLNDFNNENEDSELNKYVLKMIVKQAAKGLNQDDKDDVLNSLENDDMDDNDMNNEDDINESISLTEFIDNIVNTQDTKKQKIPYNQQRLNNPFISKR